MANQSNFDHEEWGFNFQGQPYLEPIPEYPDPFAFPDFYNGDGGELWVGNGTSTMHGPISSGMDTFFGNDIWMDSQPLVLGRPIAVDREVTNDLKVAFSYHMGSKSESNTNSSSSGLATPLNSTEPSISPAQMASEPLAPLLERRKKRRMEDYQLEFMGPQPVQNEKRRRQPYQTMRRIEVGMIRQLGACIRCKIMKTPCSSGKPCVKCAKHCGDPHLSQALCTREKLLEFRLNALKPG